MISNTDFNTGLCAFAGTFIFSQGLSVSMRLTNPMYLAHIRRDENIAGAVSEQWSYSWPEENGAYSCQNQAAPMSMP